MCGPEIFNCCRMRTIQLCQHLFVVLHDCMVLRSMRRVCVCEMWVHPPHRAEVQTSACQHKGGRINGG